MKAVAVYNMKGGVGKTTTAVNLSFLAAAAGQRVLLWDLDPQGASSFAFRVRPRVAAFGKKSLDGDGEALAAAIKETDYDNLDLLPADFAYRKFDRLLESLGRPQRVMRELLDALGRNYDAVFLDCPAGFSLLIEGVIRAADLVLVPTIPTVLSLRTVARLVKWADRSDLPSKLVAFLSMVDRRKKLHRRACQWSASYPELFLAGQIPYASVVEQIGVQRRPLAVFAARDAATIAFAGIWAEVQGCLQGCLQQAAEARSHPRDWPHLLRVIESLILRLDLPDGRETADLSEAPAVDVRDVIHSFDTMRRDLKRCGHVLELREGQGSLLVVAARCGSSSEPVENDENDLTVRAQAQIDNSWAVQILSGEMSPLTALDQRLGRPGPGAVEDVRRIVGERTLQRVDSHPMSAQERGVQKNGWPDAALMGASGTRLKTVNG